ncbi:hypothetical protein Lal_00027506 [Lupinus albus]|uniref:Uncharacterized protein n=1 Tax=Lupinus albus TaxID=3870 RepID=A0A6A4QFI1_LUPAL|nr:hypothetical protein Lalb_Chr05g0211541 [Lupinus albus]KAF1873468.1 hypothetical protein Lal_00027506 [Lupinus albus]
MGNCMETCTLRQQDDAAEIQKQHQQEEETGRKINGDDDKGKKNVLRVKVVLTKEELKWLMLQLNNDKKGMRLEQALEEIERGRDQKVHEGWKPSLESISEAPEMLEIHTSFP